MNSIEYQALHLRDNRWAVRPQGCLGTCGWLRGGTAWTVVYVHARTAREALSRAAWHRKLRGHH